MSSASWHDLGLAVDFTSAAVSAAHIGRTKITVTYVDGQFGALSGVCNHAGGPLAGGAIDGEYLVCPWHNWKYHCRTGAGEPGYELDAVPRYEVRVHEDHLWINLETVTKRTRAPHERHALARPPKREPGPVRVLGISTTNMDVAHPRYSTSDALLDVSLDFARTELGASAERIALAELAFRHCEGYYSKAAEACTWPCSITQMDPADQLDRVYEAIVHWADVILVSTPIRWGNASSLYYKMVERMNCIQNQMTIANRVLLRNKVTAFIITGGQDNIQAVAGQMMGFFGEIGCHMPQFPYIAHSRGWSAEDMERNIAYVQESSELREGAQMLVARAIDTAQLLIEHETAPHAIARGGRKAHHLALGGSAEEEGADRAPVTG
ncbi:MAG: Rieske 2Fe-2S domain-containing protein [Gemmatimonadaceae bacterium]